MYQLRKVSCRLFICTNYTKLVAAVGLLEEARRTEEKNKHVR